jgi:hypothetical protein
LAADATRRGKAHVPEEIVFKTKPEIALDQLRWACAADLPRGVVLLDAGYGNHTNLRTEIGALDLTYVAGILSSTTVWAPGMQPLTPKRWSGRDGGRPGRGAAPSTNLSQSTCLRWTCPSDPGARSAGARALAVDFPRDLPVSVRALPVVVSCAARNGC